MKQDDGTLSFGTAIDLTGFDEGMSAMESKVSNLGSSVEAESSKIIQALQNIPTLNIDVVSNAAESLSTIQTAYDEIDRVVDANGAAIRELENEYKRLSEVEKEAMSNNADAGQIEAIKQEKQAIEEVIAVRQQVIEEAGRTADALLQTEQRLKAEALAMNEGAMSAEQMRQKLGEIGAACMKHETDLENLEKEYYEIHNAMGRAFNSGNDAEYNALRQKEALLKKEINTRKKLLSELRNQSDVLEQNASKIEKNTETTKKNETAQVSIRTRLRQLREELVAMEAAGLRGTAQYEAMRADAATLTDAWADATTQANILAHDQRGMQGMISGLAGVSGAFTVAQGAVALFAGENEDLQLIMQKVQTLMAMTIGLQQVQQTLNKDSAFTLVTLNGLKEWWNKLLAIGRGEQIASAASTAADTAAQLANTAATQADTAAQTANNAATAAGTVAQGANTAGQVANTGAAVAGTAANIGLAGAFRMVGAAIKSIPVFGWIAAAIGAIIGVVSHFIGKANEADKELEEQQELLEESRKAYLKASVEIEDYTRKIEDFNGTSEQEKHLVDELNSKYGEQMGYCSTLAEWKVQLQQKGKAYCQVLMLEAKAQAILNKYTEAYVNLLEVKDKAEKGEFDRWYRTKKGDQKARREAISEAQAEVNKWESQYKTLQQQILDFKEDNDLNFHIDPKTNKPTSTTPTFDPKKAARAEREAVNDWKEAMKRFLKDANEEITEYQIEIAGDGLTRELNDIAYATHRKKEAWKQQLRDLADVRKQAFKDYYMAQEGATEEGWEQSNRGKMTTDDYVKELLGDPKVAEEFYRVLNAYTEQGERQMAEVRQQYTDDWIEQFGTAEQKSEVILRKWTNIINSIPKEFRNEALNQMEAELSALDFENFKASINWDSVFGDLGNQSLQSLQYNLQKIQAEFDRTKGSMSVTEIKDYQEAISKLENEIASRNPFAAFHKSLNDISTSKTEFVNAMTEWKTAQDELTLAKQTYNEALAREQELQAQVDNGTLAESSQEYIDAIEATRKAKSDLNAATDKEQKAEQRTLTARNNITVAYKRFATDLKSCTGVVTGLGDKAKNLAAVFSDDIADGIGKAMDFIDDIMGATSDVISAIGDVGKGVAQGVESTVAATAQGATAAAATGATAISTIEKASVILAVISAALQVATAIANLFNNDDDKQKEIENLQRRIDQLQWELDNAEAVRLQNKVGDAVERLKNIYADVTQEVLDLHLTTQQKTNQWTRYFAQLVYSSEIYQKSIEKIADAYASVGYTADKALGEDKYKESRKQLENLAEQQILLQKQINAEEDKKKTDHGKIEEWERQIAELSAEMAAIINEMLEEIIGFTSEDLATELGNAFVEAAAKGEDAMEAWRDKVNEIIADVTKRMLITKFLEEPLGQIFDKYKKKWFGEDGNFKGIDVVLDSMTGFSNDLNAVGEGFQEIWNSLPDNVKEWFGGDAEREAVQKGIATASQESVDENNARVTTIQGHTYSLVQGVTELNRTGNAILEKVTGIEKNTKETNDKLDKMSNDVKNMKSSLDNIETKGIYIKT